VYEKKSGIKTVPRKEKTELGNRNWAEKKILTKGKLTRGGQFHLIHETPEQDCFGWCTGGCWVTQAANA
jgi:hypothetical protein